MSRETIRRIKLRVVSPPNGRHEWSLFNNQSATISTYNSTERVLAIVVFPWSHGCDPRTWRLACDDDITASCDQMAALCDFSLSPSNKESQWTKPARRRKRQSWDIAFNYELLVLTFKALPGMETYI